MKKIFSILIIFVSLFANAQVDRFPDGFYIEPKSTFPSVPFEGQFHYDSITNIAYFYDGTGWVSMAADDGDTITIENIAPLVLETYIIDLQNGNDTTGQYQNGAQPFLTLQAALDDAAARSFADYKNINFRILGTGTAYITKKHSNINCNFYAVDGANISYANYVPLGGDLVVLEGNLSTSNDRKAQNMHFQYQTSGEVIFGNTNGDVLDFGRGFDLTIKASKLTGLANFSFGKIQILSIDVLETEWNYGAFTGTIGSLADTRVLNHSVHFGDITLNTHTGTFTFSINGGHDIELSFKSITSNTITDLDFRGILNYSNTAKYSIGSVTIPSLINASVISYTDAELTVDVSNVKTWSDNLYLSYFDNENVTYTGTADFTDATTPLGRYRLRFKDADIKMNKGVITNSPNEIALFLDNTNIEYNDYLVARNGSPVTYTQPNYKIKGICYIDNLGSQNDIFDNLDPTLAYSQSIEIDGKLITYNCTYDGSASNGDIPNPNITVNQHITQESNSGSGGGSSETASSIKTKYESNSDTNAFTDAEKIKLTGIESNATTDQTGAEIVSAIDTELGQTDWKTANSSSIIEHKSITASYNLVLDDAAKVLTNNGLGDELIEIPDNATLAYPTGTALLFHAVATTDTLRVSFLNNSARHYVKTKQAAFGEKSFMLVQRDIDDWYPKGDFEFYTPAIPAVAPSFVSGANAESATNSIAFSGLTPTNGNVLFASISVQESVNFNTPTGWTLISEIDGAYSTFVLLYKISDGTETAPTFTNDGAGGQTMYGQIIEFTGVNTSTPYTSLATTGEVTSNPLAINALTSTTANSLAVSFVQFQRGSGTFDSITTAPTNYVERYSSWTNSGGDAWHLCYTQDVATAGAIAADSISFANQENLVSFNLVLNPE